MPLGQNFRWNDAASYLGISPDWYEDDSQMREDIQARWDNSSPAARKRFGKALAHYGAPTNSAPSNTTPTGATPMTFGGNDQGLAHAYGGFNMAQAMIGQQNSHLQNMANQINSTISDQNENMVAQQREQRRLEHEKQMKQMEIDALLARLQQVQPPQGRQPVASGRNFSIYHD